MRVVFCLFHNLVLLFIDTTTHISILLDWNSYWGRNLSLIFLTPLLQNEDAPPVQDPLRTVEAGCLSQLSIESSDEGSEYFDAGNHLTPGSSPWCITMLQLFCIVYIYVLLYRMEVPGRLREGLVLF